MLCLLNINILNENASFVLVELLYFHTHSGKRKPSPDFYLQAVDHLNVEPASCIFIDDRLVMC